MQKIHTFLWFDGRAEEAAEFYVSVFAGRPGTKGPTPKILDVSRYGEAGPGAPGSAMTVSFELEGQQYTALNGGPQYSFTEAVSLFVDCESQEEVDYLWERFTADGGSEDRCGWLKDRYGLSWQIIPTRLGELLGDPDPARAQAAMKAMLDMNKIDIAGLQAAADAA